jgi:hypothetical protein
VGAQLAGIVAGAHRRHSVVWSLRPELVYVTGRPEAPVVTGLAPRCERFWSFEAPRDVGPPPVFVDLFTAPERTDGDGGSGGDVFAVGAVLWYLATGAPPFPGAHAGEQARAARNGTAEPGPRTYRCGSSWRLASTRGPADGPRPTSSRRCSRRCSSAPLVRASRGA